MTGFGDWVLTWKGALVSYLVASLVVVPLLWAALLTPRRRAERSAERCADGRRMCPARQQSLGPHPLRNMHYTGGQRHVRRQ